jgi:hypothetical protein
MKSPAVTAPNLFHIRLVSFITFTVRRYATARIGEQRIERRRRGSPAKNFFDVEYAIHARPLFQPQPQDRQ